MKTFTVSVSAYFILTLTSAVLPLSFVVPSAAVAVSLAHSRSSHGEPCNRTSRCDTGAWLGCFNGVCDCIKQDEMIYENKVKKCVSKSGERCAFAVDDAADKNFIFEVTACVANATCSPEGICNCGNKFYENENGTCSPAIGHQKSCDSFSKKCSQYQGLQCIEGLCQCHKSTSIYSTTEEGHGPQCVGLAEQQCVNSLCTHNATCSAGNECACADSLYADEKSLCVPKIKILGNCTATSQCEQNLGQKLVCLNRKCNCDPTISIYGTAQASQKYSDTNIFYRSIYNPHTKRIDFDQPQNEKFHRFGEESKTQCVGLVDSPCLDRLCTSNAFCAYSIYKNSPGYAGICKCKDSFTQSKRGTCATGYETPCSTTSTCIDDLVCRSLKCLCPYVTQSFDASRKSCISQVGGPCTDNSSCGENAECIIWNGVGHGHCTCKSSFVENSSGKCKAAHGTECSSSTECDTLASLECVDQKCKCTTFSKYSSKSRKCVGLSGAKCNLKSLNPERECTQNSECKEAPHPLIPGTCTCRPGFIETSNYTCEVKAGVGNSEDL